MGIFMLIVHQKETASLTVPLKKMLLLSDQTVHDQGNDHYIIQYFKYLFILLLFDALRLFIDHEQIDELAYFIRESFGF